MRHTDNSESLERRVRLRQVWGGVAGYKRYGGISVADLDRRGRSLLLLGGKRLDEEAVHSGGYEDLAREGGHLVAARPWSGREMVMAWQTDRLERGRF